VPEPFRLLLSPALVRLAAAHLARALPRFARARFETLALDGFEALEMKARAMRIADALEATLPGDFARAAAAIGWRCIVVVPHDANPVKTAAIRAAGAELVTCEPGLAPREAALAEVVARTGAEVVHPFDDSRVIAGQGTAAMELLADHPDLDVLTAPVGGGGLLAGSALAVRGMLPSCRVVGAEPEVADDAARSFHGGVRVGMPGSPPTIADGLRGSIGVRPYALFRRHVDDVVTVSERAIVEAMRIALEDLRILVEPSSAVPIAALLAGRIGAPGQRIGVIVSGGNVDLSVCPFLNAARA